VELQLLLLVMVLVRALLLLLLQKWVRERKVLRLWV
jgi:hypothetical protein